MLFKVWDQKGECFEVTPFVAKGLVVDHGWSLEEPEVSSVKVEPVAIPEDKKE